MGRDWVLALAGGWFVAAGIATGSLAVSVVGGIAVVLGVAFALHRRSRP